MPQPPPPPHPTGGPATDADAPTGTEGDALAEETAWVLAAQAGDRDAFAKLVERYWEQLHRWLIQLTHDRHRAEDLTQETFLKVLANLPSFRAGSNFRAWVFRIAHNNFVNLKRADRKQTQPWADEPADTVSPSSETIASDREFLRAVQGAVDALGPEFRSALLLRAEEGLSFREVAQVLQITEETARWRVFKARQRLVAHLGLDAEGNRPEPGEGGSK